MKEEIERNNAIRGVARIWDFRFLGFSPNSTPPGDGVGGSFSPEHPGNQRIGSRALSDTKKFWTPTRMNKVTSI